MYKLWLDYLNAEVTKLSIMDTVVAMRRQRCLMVQKKEQYTYIAKCLRWTFDKRKTENLFPSVSSSVWKKEDTTKEKKTNTTRPKAKMIN